MYSFLKTTFLFLMLFTVAFAQKNKTSALPSYEHSKLLKEEIRLKKEFESIFLDSIRSRKLRRNEVFAQKLYKLLENPQTYEYPFDSLGKVVYLVEPEDKSFRIFTWFLADSLENHYYYGIIQRRLWKNPKKPKEGYTVKLYKLRDRVDKFKDAERMSLDNNYWFGALYYKPRNSEYGVLTYEGKYLKMHGLKGKTKKKKIKYYVVLGWNGHNRYTNYKVIDVISFSPDTQKVYFGAPIFYYGNVPKYRVVLKYTDHSPLTLNKGFIAVPKKNGKKIDKYPALIFDHLSVPKGINFMGYWTAGADGTYDALVFAPKRWKELRQGVFLYVPDVNVWAPEIEEYDPEEIRKLAEKERQKMEEQGIYLK